MKFYLFFAKLHRLVHANVVFSFTAWFLLFNAVAVIVFSMALGSVVPLLSARGIPALIFLEGVCWLLAWPFSTELSNWRNGVRHH